MPNHLAIGIDLGTSNSCISVWINGKPEIILNDIGDKITPSYISFTKDKINILFCIKRLIGKNYEDKELQEDMKLCPFKIIKDPKSDKPKLLVNYQNQEKDFYAEEILAMILSYLKLIASNFLKKEIKEAIIAIPNYFNELQKQAIKDIATISGLTVIRFYSESTLAGISYGFDNHYKKENNIIVFDLGGGFLNISLISIDNNLYEVKAVNGNNHLGGEDFDRKLMEYCIDEFKKKYSIDIKDNSRALRRLKKYCEKAKIDLSSSKSTNIIIEDLIDGKDSDIIILRSKFEEICVDLFKKCITH